MLREKLIKEGRLSWSSNGEKTEMMITNKECSNGGEEFDVEGRG